MADEEDFAALLDQSLASSPKNKLGRGQKVEGRVVQIGHDTVFVDVGTRSEGQIDKWELTDREGNLQVSVGDRVRGTVMQSGDRPKLTVSIGKGGVDAAQLELAAESQTPVDGTVTKVVKGGLEVDVGSVRCFCPASQVDRTYVEDLGVFEGQTLHFLVMEVRDQGRSVVLSRRKLLESERHAQAAEKVQELEEGSTVQGTVTSIKEYGAFVDIGGLEGLVHISQLGQGHVERVSDVVSMGEQVEVRVLGIEAQEGKGVLPRIRLSMRQMTQQKSGKPAGRVVEGTVVKVETFGVVVETEHGSGVVPTRELDLAPGSDPRRAYPVGKTIKVVELGQDPQGRQRLSVRRVEEAEARHNYLEFRSESTTKAKAEAGMGSFGDLLKKKLR